MNERATNKDFASASRGVETEKEKQMNRVKSVEQTMMSLQLEQKKLVAEFDKIPENAKTIAQRRRREELDREI